MLQKGQLSQSSVVRAFALPEPLKREVARPDVLSGPFRSAWPSFGCVDPAEASLKTEPHFAFSSPAHSRPDYSILIAPTGRGSSHHHNHSSISGRHLFGGGEVVPFVAKHLVDSRSFWTPATPQPVDRSTAAPTSAVDGGDLTMSSAGRAVARIAPEAERFAKRRGLWGSAVLLTSRLVGSLGSADSLKLDLVADPEVNGWSVLCATIRTNAPLQSALRLDSRLREIFVDSIASVHSIYFAMKFDLVE